MRSIEDDWLGSSGALAPIAASPLLRCQIIARVSACLLFQLSCFASLRSAETPHINN